MPSKKLTRGKVVKKLDAIFSQYIRLKYADDHKNVSCFTCDKKAYWHADGMQCGHFMSRKHYATRWNENGNCMPQCVSCNVYNYGRQFVFAKNLDEKFGEGTAEDLYIKSKQIVKFSTDELNDKIKHFKQLVDKMK